MVDETADMGIRMYDRANGEAIPEPQTESDRECVGCAKDDSEPPPHTDGDEIPF